MNNFKYDIFHKNILKNFEILLKYYYHFVFISLIASLYVVFGIGELNETFKAPTAFANFAVFFKSHPAKYPTIKAPSNESPAPVGSISLTLNPSILTPEESSLVKSVHPFFPSFNVIIFGPNSSKV